jgi:flagellar biosynthesis/type III secretory pathway protein FliH
MREQPERPDYDQTLKRLLSRARDGFLALVAPGLTWRAELSPELPAVARQADLVWEVEGRDRQRGLLHIELQTKPNADIGERVAEYGLRLWRREHRPVRSLVIFLRPAETVPQSPFVLDWMGEEYLRYAFGVIRMWEVPQERVLGSQYAELWPLAGLMANVTPESTQRAAEQILAAPLPVHERDELTRSLALLAGMRLSHQALRDALRRAHMTLNLWEESTLKEALADMAREEGLEEGLEQGLEQGRALGLEKGLEQGLEQGRALGLEQGLEQGRTQGLAEGMRTSIRLVLEGRFGTLDEALTAAIERAGEDILKAALPHAASDSLEQVRGRLAAE